MKLSVCVSALALVGSALAASASGSAAGAVNAPALKAALGSEPLSANPLVASDSSQDSEGSEPSQDFQSFYMAVSMIVVSEIGDKTFLIAALMSMKHPRWLVFSAGFSSLAIMTILSGVVGHALPSLISRRLTQFLAAMLFIVFGIKLFHEGLSMPKDASVSEEMAEVEEELQASDINGHAHDLESGGAHESKQPDLLAQVSNLASFVFSPVWMQVFVMTFLGEWGDRSQIATIAMAAGSDYWFVIFGAIVGHGLCTAAATIGGQLLAKRISMRSVTLGGAAAFIVFAFLYFYDFVTYVPETE